MLALNFDFKKQCNSCVVAVFKGSFWAEYPLLHSCSESFSSRCNSGVLADSQGHISK